MQQFEASIQRIATGVQSIDPAVTGARDRAAAGDHRRPARSHRSHRHRAQPLGAPEPAAHRSGRRAGGSARGRPAGARARGRRSSGCRTASAPGPQYAPRFSDEDVVRARRRRGAALGADIAYAGRESARAFQVSGSVGPGANAPGPGAARRRMTRSELQHAEAPARMEAGAVDSAHAVALAEQIERVRALRSAVAATGKRWRAARARAPAPGRGCTRARPSGSARRRAGAGGSGPAPVSGSAGRVARRGGTDPRLRARGGQPRARQAAVRRRRCARAGPARRRRSLNAVRVAGQVAAGAGDWRHVAGYLDVAGQVA